MYDRIYLKEEAAILRDTQGVRHTELRRQKPGTDREQSGTLFKIPLVDRSESEWARRRWEEMKRLHFLPADKHTSSQSSRMMNGFLLPPVGAGGMPYHCPRTGGPRKTQKRQR